MPRDLRFCRNVILIGLAHVAVLVGLTRWSGLLEKPPKTQVVWIAAATGAVLQPTPEASPEPPGETEEAETTTTPATTPAPSNIVLPTATPRPAPPSATPRPKPSATPKATATPKPSKSPKPSTKPTPKPKKKSTPKPSVTPTTKPKSTPKESATAAPVNEGGASGSEPGGRGAANAVESNWYGNMRDRFFGAWTQPKTASATGSRMAALVQVRIEKDGRVSDFKIVRSSGNVVVDESIAAVQKRVTKVDPLPAGLARGGSYEVKIRFELDVQ